MTAERVQSTERLPASRVRPASRECNDDTKPYPFATRTQSYEINLDLNLFQISGELGIKLNGDRSTCSNQNSSGGEITVHTRGGQEGLLLDGDHNNAGRIEVRQANKSICVDIFGRGSGESGEMRVNRYSGAQHLLLGKPVVDPSRHLSRNRDLPSCHDHSIL